MTVCCVIGRPQPGALLKPGRATVESSHAEGAGSRVEYDKRGTFLSQALQKRTEDVNSLIGWVGGKRLLASTIVELLPHHSCYVEVFGGAAWVLFRKKPVDAEIYNDVNSRLVELFRSVKWHPDELVRELEFLPPSRELFDQFIEQRGLTELQRAARFYYVIKMSFGCKGENFGFSSRSPKRLIQAKVISDIEKVRARLERATVECDDFTSILERYDRAGTCFFCDPPYYGSEDCYEAAFGEVDHERLERVLSKVEGSWLVTYNDCAWVRQTYSDYHCYAVTADYTVASGGPRPGHQLIITNYELEPEAIEAAPKSLVPLDRLDQIQRT